MIFIILRVLVLNKVFLGEYLITVQCKLKARTLIRIYLSKEFLPLITSCKL